MPDKTKIHTVYKNQAGDRVPSVTTILSVLAKPALIEWAWRMGTEGKDFKAVRDQAGDIGSLVHMMILADLKGEKLDLSEYSPSDVDKAETCLIKYWEWVKANPQKTMLCEAPLVSELGYGGTPDWFGTIGNILTLVDYKSGKAIYAEFFSQAAAYAELLKENGYGYPEQVRIIRIGRDDTEQFEDRTITGESLGGYFEIFLACLKIYQKRKELKL